MNKHMQARSLVTWEVAKDLIGIAVFRSVDGQADQMLNLLDEI